MNLINNKQKLDDLIFENRNKNYGAYAIRSAYGHTMFKSLACMVFGFSSIICTAYYVSERPVITEIPAGQVPVEKIYSVPFDLEKEKKPEAVPDKAAGKKPENKLNTALSTVVKNDSSATETSTVINLEVQNSLVSTNSNTAVGGETGEDEKKGSEKGKGTTSAIRGNYEVDSNAEFEGGLAALYKFVSSHLKYPGRALDEGVQGTVFVKFVVDENGKVGDLSLQNNLGYGLDEEAKRVVGMIPNFKTPAKVNGEPVKVYYHLPIKFRYK